jgi:hypothetical protein
MTGQTRTIAEALCFLNRDYEAFLRLSNDEQAAAKQWNTMVQQHVQSTQTVRDLYIELMLCDTMLSFEAKVKTSSKRKRTILAQKESIIQQIRRREKLEETIVPNPAVWKAAEDCQGDDDKIVEALLQWVPDGERDSLRAKCQEGRSKDKWLFRLVETISHKRVVTKLNQAEDFQNYVCMTECLERFVALKN